MYVQTLDRFDVPETDDWPLKVTYFPEPPIAIRGALNPWEMERKRVLWLRENDAWAKIQPLQSAYRQKLAEYDQKVIRFNQLVSEIEKLTGQKGLQRIMGSRGFQAASLAITTTNPYGAVIAAVLAAASLLETGFKILSGEAKRKKKRVQQLTNALQDVGKDLEAISAALNSLAQNILALTFVREQTTRELDVMDKANRDAMARSAIEKDTLQRTSGKIHAAQVNALRQSAGKKAYYGTL